MSRVMCHVSGVTCHLSHVTFFGGGQSGEAYRLRVCYQRGLPRLVFELLDCEVYQKYKFIKMWLYLRKTM